MFESTFLTHLIWKKSSKNREKGSDCAAATSAGSHSSSLSSNTTRRMPLRTEPYAHRSPINDSFVYPACVARSVTKKEAKATPKAMEALDKAWNKLHKQTCWDVSRVCEWTPLAKRAQAAGKKLHIGRAFDICVEKNSELENGNPNRKFKGRVVFEGCYVKDELNNWAIFAEITSCLATMEAGKAADGYGLLSGHDVQQADGESAYAQAKLGGEETWIRLPPDRWPKEWVVKYIGPVCPLILALYGHPDAGGFWERHCGAALALGGFEPIPEWKSCFWHPRLKLLLVVYVDDFKLSGPAQNLAEGWRQISKGIIIEPPAPAGRYLGCDHLITNKSVPNGFDPRLRWMVPYPPKKDPPDLLSKPGAVFAAAKSAGVTATSSSTNGKGKVSVRVCKYDMCGFLDQCVNRYIELSHVTAPLKHVATPFLDEGTPEFDENDLSNSAVGILWDIASSVLLKILYAARRGRHSPLIPVSALAPLAANWL